MEETRALQSRLEKSAKIESQNNNHHTLFNEIRAGASLSLHATQATIGRFTATNKQDPSGFYVEWVLDGEGLFRGDRILEANGKLVTARTQEEFQKMLGPSGKCHLVVIRKRTSQQQQHQLMQSQADNQRLQHRISYLEDQVKELQDSTREIKAPSSHSSTTPSSPVDRKTGGHVTSISISSSPTTTPTDGEKPQVFQRGNYVTTIIGTKTLGNPSANKKQQNITKTMIKEMNGNRSDAERDLHQQQYNQHRNHYNMLQHSHSQQYLGPNGNAGHAGPIKSMSSSKISINSDIGHFPIIKREREKLRDYNGREVRRNGDDEVDGSSTNSNKTVNGGGSRNAEKNGRNSESTNHHYRTNGYSSYSVEHLNGYVICR